MSDEKQTPAGETRVNEIRERWRWATPGPFMLDGRRMVPECAGHVAGTAGFTGVMFSHQSDAEFYAHAWDDVKYLLEENLRLRRAFWAVQHAVDDGLRRVG